MKRIRKFFSIAGVRLTAIYTGLFGLMAVGLIFYLTSSTIGLLRHQISVSINNEISELADIYEDAGLNEAISSLEIRARAPGANLYIVSSPTGQILAGNVYDLDNGVLTKIGWTGRPFAYSRFDASTDAKFRAVARVVEMPNGMRLLVGRDIGEPERFYDIIFNALVFALVAMVALGFLTWFFVGRRALKRIDLVSKSTEKILAGDHAVRLPITGSGDEFDRLSTRLNSMLDKINTLDEGLRQVSDNIAHDLKTPLTRIRNTVEAALSKPNNKNSDRGALEKILAESETLIKTFNALLMISRVESGSSAAAMENINVSSIVGDIVELYEPLIEEDGDKLRSDITQELHVRGNRELLSQAISNLIDNAMKYGKSKKSGELIIDVTATKQENYVLITVSDSGDGVPKSARKKVFERFQRLEDSRSKPGSGLGLSLVKAISEMHGGKITLEDNNPGLRAVLAIPIL